MKQCSYINCHVQIRPAQLPKHSFMGPLNKQYPVDNHFLGSPVATSCKLPSLFLTAYLPYWTERVQELFQWISHCSLNFYDALDCPVFIVCMKDSLYPNMQIVYFNIYGRWMVEKQGIDGVRNLWWVNTITRHWGGGGGGTQVYRGVRTRVPYFAEEGVFFKTPRFC